MMKNLKLILVKILYSQPINAFTLVVDKNDGVFVAKTIKYEQFEYFSKFK